MSLESIEKLRKLPIADKMRLAAKGGFSGAVGFVVENAAILFDIDCKDAEHVFEALADEIERDYMRLPVDADGVPIHVGDLLELGDTRDNVAALSYRPDKSELPWEWLSRDDGCWYNTAFSHHVKPRTVEDVLDDFARAQGYLHVDHQYKGITDYNELRSQYAAELRMRDAE